MKHVYVAKRKEPYDAIVVGSGIAGGWAAKELCEKGLKTLVLERGRNVRHGEDYPTEHTNTWSLDYRGLDDRKLNRSEYAVQSRCYAFGESTKHFFVNDAEHPYIAEKPFTWIRGYQVGGRSLIWGRQCYRMGPQDFTANIDDGVGVDWPIRYEDIAPWYSYVERFAGISGQAEGLEHQPDGEFLPPLPFNHGELLVKERMERAFPERRLTMGRAAVLTQAHLGRGPCHYCGICQRGCSPGAYFSSNAATLPAAEATGNMTLRPHSIVHSVIYDDELGKATGVRVIDAETNEMVEFEADVIFLCASTLGTTQIMLNSTSTRFPNGLANDSGTLGHHLMDHHFQLGAFGIIPGHEDVYYSGNRPSGVYVPRFRNLGARSRRSDYRRGFGYQGGASRAGWQRPVPGFGEGLKAALRDPGPWEMNFHAFGETLPNYDNYVYLDESAVDQWGIPLLRISMEWGENEFAMRKDMMESAAEMLDASGCTDIVTYDNYTEGGLGAEPGLGIHEMGTARMGRDPRTSVLNANNQCHDVPNVFVTDGACMTSAGCQNPSITYMALTARAAEFAVTARQQRNL